MMVEAKSDQIGDGDNLLSLPQAAKELRISYEASLRWVRQGELKASMVGGRYLVHKADLEAFRTWWLAHPRVQRSLKGQEKAEA